jgi:hypothetical protein
VFHAQLKPPICIVRARDSSRGRVLDPYELESPPPGGFKFETGEPDQIVSSCHLATGIILTHDCEIDKDSKHRTIILVRQFGQMRENDAQIIREHKNRRFFYLPRWGNALEESYVDFRRVSCVDPRLVNLDQRVASLTDWGRKQFLMAYFMYITRAEPEGLEKLIGSREP